MNAVRTILGLVFSVTLGPWTAMIRGLTRTLAVLALVGGSLLILYLGGRSPEWMMKGEVLIVLTFALVYGFTAFSPRLPDWFRYQEVRGVSFVALGCIALFVPAQFLVSSCLIGLGAKLVMTSNRVSVRVRPDGTPLGRGSGDIVLRENGTIVTRD